MSPFYSKRIEDKHVEDGGSVKVAFESSKHHEDADSVVSVVTLVQDLCRQTSVTSKDKCFNESSDWSEVHAKSITPKYSASSLAAQISVISIHTQTSSPYAQRKITPVKISNDYMGDYASFRTMTHHTSTPQADNRADNAQTTTTGYVYQSGDGFRMLRHSISFDEYFYQ